MLAGEVADLRVIALLDDYAGFETSLYGQHGIALLVELYSGGETRRILLDTGQEAAPILHNMEILGIDPAAIDCIFLSHCHYDHTGGLAGILRAIGREIPVVAHPELFRENYIRKPFLRHIGVSRENSPEAIRAAGGHLLLTGEAFAPCRGFPPASSPSGCLRRSAIGTYNLEGAPTLDNLRDECPWWCVSA